MISKDGCTHKLIVQNCKDSDAGLYHFEVNGCKTEAMVRVGGNYIKISLSFIYLNIQKLLPVWCYNNLFLLYTACVFARSSRI